MIMGTDGCTAVLLIQKASLGKEKTSPSPGRSSLGLSHLTPKPLKPSFLSRFVLPRRFSNSLPCALHVAIATLWSLNPGFRRSLVFRARFTPFQSLVSIRSRARSFSPIVFPRSPRSLSIPLPLPLAGPVTRTSLQPHGLIKLALRGARARTLVTRARSSMYTDTRARRGRYAQTSGVVNWARAGFVFLIARRTRARA